MKYLWESFFERDLFANPAQITNNLFGVRPEGTGQKEEKKDPGVWVKLHEKKRKEKKRKNNQMIKVQDRKGSKNLRKLALRLGR